MPVENRLGGEGEGFKIAMRTFDHHPHAHRRWRRWRRARRLRIRPGYAHERKQFGRPIFSFQAIAFMLAEMAMNIDAARLLAWRAAALYDRGPAVREGGAAWPKPSPPTWR